MKKNLLKNFSFCLCAVCAVNGGDCCSMEIYSTDSPDLSRNKDISSTFNSEHSTASNSPKSDNCLDEDKWIEERKDLINLACYNEDQFEELLNALEIDKHVAYYDTIVTRWNDKNIFDAFHNNEKSTASFKKDVYDW